MLLSVQLSVQLFCAGINIREIWQLHVRPYRERTDGHGVRIVRDNEHVVESARGAVHLPDLTLQPEHRATPSV